MTLIYNNNFEGSLTKMTKCENIFQVFTKHQAINELNFDRTTAKDVHDIAVDTDGCDELNGNFSQRSS